MIENSDNRTSAKEKCPLWYYVKLKKGRLHGEAGRKKKHDSEQHPMIVMRLILANMCLQ